jgi:hypothetical protein
LRDTPLEGDYERTELHSAAHARELGRALIAAADEVNQMNSRDDVDPMDV